MPRKGRYLRRSIARSFEEEGAPTTSSSRRRLMCASPSKRRRQRMPPPTSSDCNCPPPRHRSRPRATSIEDDGNYCNYCHVHHHHLNWNLPFVSGTNIPASAEAEATAADDAAADEDKRRRQTTTTTTTTSGVDVNPHLSSAPFDESPIVVWWKQHKSLVNVLVNPSSLFTARTKPSKVATTAWSPNTTTNCR